MKNNTHVKKMTSLHHSGPLTTTSSCQADAISKQTIVLLEGNFAFYIFIVFHMARGLAYDSPLHHFIIIIILLH